MRSKQRAIRHFTAALDPSRPNTAIFTTNRAFIAPDDGASFWPGGPVSSSIGVGQRIGEKEIAFLRALFTPVNGGPAYSGPIKQVTLTIIGVIAVLDPQLTSDEIALERARIRKMLREYLG